MSLIRFAILIPLILYGGTVFGQQKKFNEILLESLRETASGIEKENNLMRERDATDSDAIDSAYRSRVADTVAPFGNSCITFRDGAAGKLMENLCDVPLLVYRGCDPSGNNKANCRAQSMRRHERLPGYLSEDFYDDFRKGKMMSREMFACHYWTTKEFVRDKGGWLCKWVDNAK